MHLVSRIPDGIRLMGAGYSFTTDITERLYIANLEEA
jgi:hypothetical protein